MSKLAGRLCDMTLEWGSGLELALAKELKGALRVIRAARKLHRQVKEYAAKDTILQLSCDQLQDSLWEFDNPGGEEE